MIEKINFLKNQTKNENIKALCEKATSTIDSTLYKDIPQSAKIEVEKAIIEGLFEGLKSFKDNETQEWLKNSMRIWAVKNLGIREAINTLSESEAKENLSLKQVLEHYRELLSNNPEVLLYESFITGLQSFSYFPKVGNAIKAIEDRVNNYESDISITKIMEAMKRTNSHYLVPLIEDLVQNYLDNKNSQTKSSLKEGLIKFSYDPFVRDLINLVTADATELQLEYANARCDIEKIYSPIFYLGENESVFSVKGSYYIKKGNTLSRLNKESVKRLDSEFINLCEAINNPNVVIDGKSITIYEGSDKAVIYENKILVNGQEFSNELFKNSSEIAAWTGKGRFLSLVETFRANFDEIAEIDFAKRVYLKEDQEYAADIFRLRGNISVSIFNPAMGKGTFYRNVNPIQAKNLMMEHLRFDVSKAFEDLLPNEERINEEIEDTRKSYSDYILDLEKRINEFKLNPFNKKVNEEIISALQEELDEIKEEYKDYLNLVENYVRVPQGSLNEATVSLEINGPLNIEVDGVKYSVPIPSGENGEEVKGEFGSEVGDENIEGEPASAVTFDDTNSELLGDSPSIGADEVNLGADEVTADAEAAEAEAEIDSEDAENGELGDEENLEGGEENAEGDISSVEGGEDIEGAGDADLGIEDEIKIDDKPKETSDEEEPEKEKEEGEKIDDSTSNSKPKKKVYLKKKKA